MFGSIFQRRPTPPANFAKVVKKKKDRQAVEVRLRSVTKGTKVVEGTVNIEYLTDFVVVLPKGRTIVRLGDRFTESYQRSSPDGRRKGEIKHLLRAEKNAKDLQMELPSVPVRVIGKDSLMMTSSKFELLHQDAERFHVQV